MPYRAMFGMGLRNHIQTFLVRLSAFLAAAMLLIGLTTASSAFAAAPAAPPGATQTTSTFTSNATEAVPGFGQGTLTSSLTVAGAGPYLSDVQAFTKLFHTFPGDLKVTLTSPAGVTVQMTDGLGAGNNDVFSATRWADNAGVPVSRTTFTNGAAKAALTPQQAFSRFVGSNPNGVWKLAVTDQSPDDDTGILKGWSLDVSTLPEEPTLTTHHNDKTENLTVDATPITSTINVGNVPVGSVWTPRVTTQLSTLARGALKVTLTSPDGRVVKLIDDNLPAAGPTQSMLPYLGTVFDDQADTLVTDAVASGDTNLVRVAPVEPLGAFRGEAVAGNWKLTVSDARAAGGDNLAGWSLDLVSAATLAVPKAPAMCTPTTQSFTATNNADQPVNFGTFSPANGWTQTGVAVFGAGTYLHDVKVTTRVVSPAAAKLRLQLLAPNGETVWLTRDYGDTVGGPGDQTATYSGTLFDDGAGAVNPPGSVAESGFPADGPISPVAPIQPLSHLVGSNPNGNWFLRSFDSRGAILTPGSSRTYIKGFSLKVTTLNQAPVREKTVDSTGPLSSNGAGILDAQLTVAGAGTVLDQVDFGLDAPDLPPNALIFLEGPGPAHTFITLNTGATNAADLSTRLFSNMTFTDSATRSITGMLSTAAGPDDGQFALSSGSAKYNALEPLGAFRGQNPNGKWSVSVITADGAPFQVDNISLTARTGSCADTTPPTNPTVTSPSHTVGTSSNPDLDIALAGATDNGTVAGFSYLLDHTDGTVPDTTQDTPASTTTLPFHGLADGTWYFHLRTVDAAGNWSAAVQFGPVTIDTLLPDTTIASGPTGITGAKPTFTFTANKAPITFECAIDLGGYVACPTPFKTAALSDGAHTLSVRAKDSLARVDATPDTRSFTVDSSVPDTAINSGPSGLISTTTPTWTFTSTKANSTFTCTIDGGAPTTCTTPFTPAALSNGPHTFSVYATDSGGNDDLTPATRSVTIDAVAPQTSFTSGPADGATINSTPSFGLAADEAPVTFQCKVDSGSFAACTSPFSTGTLQSGSHTISARGIDAAGNVDLTPVTRTIIIDTTAPDSFFTGGPSGTITSTQPAFTFTGTEVGSTFECSVDLGAFAPCTSPWTTPTLADGLHILSVRATDQAGNVDATPATRSVTVDNTAPDTTLGATPTGTTGPSPAFTFTSPDAGATFECSVDSGAYAACTSPKSIGPLSDGTHRIDVRAVDSVGNKDASPAGRQFTVDAIGPVTTISPAPTVNNVTAKAQATFTSDDATATYECNVDSGAYAACTSPFTTSAQTDGTHTVHVRATDTYGNKGASAAATFLIDTVAPNTTILTGPTGANATTTATLTFSSDEAGATFECNVDSDAVYAPCTSPSVLTALTEGSHTFRVRARDASNNVDATPATRTWTVDTVAPQTTIDSGPDTTSGATATFGFSSEAGSTFACSIDGAGPAACTSPKTYTGLAAGPHTFTVTATDAAGNTDATPATRTFTADLTKPTATITSGPTADAAINTDNPTLTFISSKPNSTFLCAIDSDPLTPCTSANHLTGLAQGVRTFWVVAVDAFGNQSSRAQRTFAVDLVAPATTTITAPPAVSVTGDASGLVSSSESGTFQCSIDDGAWFACDASWVTPTMPNGAHRIGVRAVDAAGNVDMTPVYFDVTVAVPTPVPPIVPDPTPTPTPTPTPPVIDIGPAIALLSPATSPSLSFIGKPLTVSRSSVRLLLRCPVSETKPCRAAVKLTALGRAKTRGLTFSSFNGTIKAAATTTLRSSVSARNKRALRGLKTIRVRLSVTMSSASGKSVTRRWDRTLRVGA